MRRAGFTIVELIVVVIVVIILVGLLFPAVSRTPQPNPQLKDATQLRGIQQSLITWSVNNDDKYPIPSLIDVDNYTVSELGRAKDTTANIMSLLVSEGFITTELLVSPKENNVRVQVYEDYEIEDISGPVNPEKALWDPALSADFLSEDGGHISYAHLIPQGKRLEMWGSTFKAEEAILSNRGPEIRSVERNTDEVITHFATPTTRTTKFFSNSSSKDNWWSGNVGYNDYHVSFVSNLYADNKAVSQPNEYPQFKLSLDNGIQFDTHDVMFADEQAPEGKDNWREAMDANQFLGIFTTAGESREDFTAIWD